MRISDWSSTCALPISLLSQGNGLAAAHSAGAITEPVALDFDNPGSLLFRAEQAQLASRWAGRPVSPLADAEDDALEESIATAGPAPVVCLQIGRQTVRGKVCCTRKFRL